jgi:hypothetical protein
MPHDQNVATSAKCSHKLSRGEKKQVRWCEHDGRSLMPMRREWNSNERRWRATKERPDAFDVLSWLAAQSYEESIHTGGHQDPARR